MKRLISAPLFVTSIIVLLAAVKTRAADLPNVSHGTRKVDSKDSAKDTGNEFKQLVDLVMTNGLDSRYGENFAPHVGLPGARPAKGKNIRSRKIYKDRGGLNCAVVYEESSEETQYPGKRPICIFLEVSKISGQDSTGRYYRLSLDGRLEKVLTTSGKNDENGKPVRGSAVSTDEDINSPEVKKAFAAEMADVRQWLKQQQRQKGPPKTAPAAKAAL